jgi:competence protein ComEC
MPLSRIFFYFCLSFIGGIALSSLVPIPQAFMLGFFIVGVVLIAVFWKKDKKFVVGGFCLLIFAAGIVRYQAAEPPEDSLAYYKEYSARQSKDHIPYLGTLKQKLQNSIDRSLSPPQSSLVSGILLGDTESFSKDFKEKLNISGTRHITAISGMNVAILGSMLVGLGLIFGLWRGQAFYVALAFIVLFTLMVGAPPSAVRAAIMGGIVLFYEKLGRLGQAERLLVFAAVWMLAVNPLLLKFDIGFQLSFLATFGILKVSPYFREKLSFVPKFFEMRNTVSMTIPAIIFTAPVLALNFGQFSLVGLFSNIVIIPALAPILGFGLVAAMTGIVFDSLGRIFFWPVWFFATYVYKIIDWSAAVPFASVKVEWFGWPLAIVYFSILIWRMRRLKLKDTI